jgi:hypothetical protein
VGRVGVVAHEGRRAVFPREHAAARSDAAACATQPVYTAATQRHTQQPPRRYLADGDGFIHPWWRCVHQLPQVEVLQLLTQHAQAQLVEVLIQA